MGHEGVLAIFFYSLFPILRQMYLCAVAIIIHINIVTRRLVRHGIAPSVRVRGGLSDISNIHFVEPDHFRRKCEYSQSINFFMREKTPAGTGQDRYYQNDFQG